MHVHINHANGLSVISKKWKGTHAISNNRNVSFHEQMEYLTFTSLDSSIT